jgi:hypothetical protein
MQPESNTDTLPDSENYPPYIYRLKLMSDNTTHNSGLFPATTDTYAEVILPLAVPKTYTYAVPEMLGGKLSPGCRVEV